MSAEVKPEIPMESFEVYATGLDHPECLAFDQQGDLWTGSEAGTIWRIGTDRKPHPVANLGSYCAGVAFSPSDVLHVCNPAVGVVRVYANGDTAIFASHVGEQKIVCANYGLFDSKGNYYVTDSGLWKKNTGYLLRFTPDGKGEILAGPMGYTNGLALSADEKTLFMIESNTNRVFRYDIAEDGKLSEGKAYAENVGRFPDGLTLDAEGNLYASCYASDEIWKIKPSGDKTLFAWDQWAIHLGSPTNMAFGGENFDELYVANLARWHVTRAKVGVKGQPLANQKAAAKNPKRRPKPL
jgi:gluconolactonase